ncbi:hypothetical protein YUWDRAFT_06603 [Streptomyces sp. AmelKG-D3]|nr:hypothetical protein YUWDRAFT_06603 [Streptomyces sp. AmelKG-D3]
MLRPPPRGAELREAMRIAARADELQAPCELGTLEQAAPCRGRSRP